MRIAILLGGPSREREISFAGGRTVYDNLDKAFFTPIPIFIDSYCKPVLLHWPALYKGTIRDFFPPAAALPAQPFPVQLYLEHLGKLSDAAYDAALQAIGTPLTWEELPHLADFTFLTLHGAYGEDGSIQGLLEWLGMPYSGCGIAGCTLGMDKLLQRRLLPGLAYAVPRWLAVPVPKNWQPQEVQQLTEEVAQQVGFPCVVKHPTQGSSIGVQLAGTPAELGAALQAAAFQLSLTAETWQAKSSAEKQAWVAQRTDLRQGLALPLMLELPDAPAQLLYQPAELLAALDAALLTEQEVLLRSLDAPDELLVEEFIAGDEFSVIVVQLPDGKALALPPTGIHKAQPLFDYRSKYLPGQARKETPMQLPLAEVQHICAEAERLMHVLGFTVYCRLDGIRGKDGTLFFNDPNTTSGMLPGSFFFQQAAEVGLAPSQFLTSIILSSLQARAREGKLRTAALTLQHSLVQQLAARQAVPPQGLRVAVVLGGYSTERHVSVESGRNVVEKLSSSPHYQPTPLFLLHHQLLSPAQRQALALPAEPPFSLWRLPANTLLKDNADDIVARIVHHLATDASNPLVAQIAARAQPLRNLVGATLQAAPELVRWEELALQADFVFLALHGRPGEDGQVQRILQGLGLPYNGSGAMSSALTIHKFHTNEALLAAGLRIPAHLLVQKDAWLAQPEALYDQLEALLAYPLIAKPADEGCSSAVKKLRSRVELAAYCEALFRQVGEAVPQEAARQLAIQPQEEIPAKDFFVLEALVSPQPGSRLLEVTVGLLTHHQNGAIHYQVFEPSETLAEGAVLSLEEKFLAGEGQNLTPARFAVDAHAQEGISAQVKQAVAAAAKTLGLEGYARIDAFVHLGPQEEVEVEFIEVNSLPALTPATCLFHQSALAGYTPLALLEEIIRQGQQRQ